MPPTLLPVLLQYIKSVLPPRAFASAQRLVLTAGLGVLAVVVVIVTGYIAASPTFGWTGAHGRMLGMLGRRACIVCDCVHPSPLHTHPRPHVSHTICTHTHALMRTQAQPSPHAPPAGRSLSLLDPTYASKYIPIIASVSEHQPPSWASYFTDLHLVSGRVRVRVRGWVRVRVRGCESGEPAAGCSWGYIAH